LPWEIEVCRASILKSESEKERTAERSRSPKPDAYVGASLVGLIHAPAVSCDDILLPLVIMTALTSEADGAKPTAGFFTPATCHPSRKYCLTRAAEPAQMGVDMLVPAFATTLQLSDPRFPSE
jgi:hypothetical protein